LYIITNAQKIFEMSFGGQDRVNPSLGTQLKTVPTQIISTNIVPDRAPACKDTQILAAS